MHESTCTNIKSKCKQMQTAVHIYLPQIKCICKDTINTSFLCSADHEQVWQPYAVDLYSAINKWWPHILCISYIIRVVLYVQMICVTTAVPVNITGMYHQ